MHQRRVQPGRREVLPGVTLTTSTMGGYTVEHHGRYIGWIHAAEGDQWNAYLRGGQLGGTPLGKYRQDEAVRAIVDAAEVNTGASGPQAGGAA